MRIARRIVASLFVCTVTCLASVNAFAQPAFSPATAAPTEPSVSGNVHPNPYEGMKNPYAPTLPKAGPSRTARPKKSKLDAATHLRLAAKHLAAAGKTKLAQQITNEALIESKSAQIRRLQTEVECLRGNSETSRMLTFRIKVLELKTGELRKLGLDFQPLGQETASLAAVRTQLKAAALDAFIEALRKQSLVKVLAEPTLVTVSGRRASLQTGSAIPLDVPQSLATKLSKYPQAGTRVDCVGTILDSGRIKLEFRANVSEIDASHRVMVEGVSMPGLRTRCVNTTIEMSPDETVVLGGMTQKSDDDEAGASEEKSVLFAVTVHVGQSVATAAKKDRRHY